MPRHNCDQLERGGYYEVRAEETCGNRGGTVPMFTSGSWARRVTVRAESHWMIADGDNGQPVFADGTGPGTDGRVPDNNCRFPGLRKWALVACWAAFEGNRVDPISPWFYVGRGGTFDVPIPSAIIPTP